MGRQNKRGRGRERELAPRKPLVSDLSAVALSTQMKRYCDYLMDGATLAAPTLTSAALRRADDFLEFSFAPTCFVVDESVCSVCPLRDRDWN